MAINPPPVVEPTPSDWHLREAAEVTQAHDVDPSQGLQDHQVNDRTLKFGINALPTADKRSLWSLVLEQFSDFMILVLLAAAVISGVVGDLVDTLVILIIVLLNAVIGLVQSWRADQALAALQRLSAAQATVLRGGQVQQVPAHVLVPGDIVLLEAGNQVPADLRLIQTAQLKVDESALTGESVTVDKHADVLAGTELALGDRLNMAFKGTTATHGRGHGLVVATGMSTELGKVADLLDQNNSRSTPLQLRLAAFGKRVALAVLAICAVIFGVGVLRGEAPLLMVMTAISLAVAAIPEALPAVVTVLLALGARKMVAVNALIRRLPSVETLGSVTYICSDKTGTLTQNRMQAQCLVAGRADDVANWMPQAEFNGTSAEKSAPADAAYTALLRAGALCNDATAAPDNTWLGDPTETALTEVAALAGLVKTELETQWPRVMELPFDAVRKRMSTFHRDSNGVMVYTKGAPESVIPVCTTQWSATAEAGSTPIDSEAWLARANALAAQGLRVLAIAQRTYGDLPENTSDTAAIERNLCLIGLIGLMDPPRREAAAAVHECMAAGITPVMITGDHPATARAIALQLGIVTDKDAPVLTGADLTSLNDSALMAQVHQVRVYARVDPAQKSASSRRCKPMGSLSL